MTPSTDAQVGVLAPLEDARALLAAAKHSEALGLLDTTLAERPDIALGWALRSWALAGLHGYKEALDSAEKALKLDESSAQGWAEKAGALFYLERYKEAANCMKRHCELTQDHTLCMATPNTCWTTRGYYEWLAGEFTDAVRSCGFALKANEDSALTNYRMGSSLVELKKYSEALPYLESQMQMTPHDEGVQSYFVRALRETSSYHSVIAECDDALSRNRRCYWALCERGYAHLKLEQYEAAVADFSHALEVNKAGGWTDFLIRSKQEAEQVLRTRFWKGVAWDVAKTTALTGLQIGVNMAADKIRERNERASTVRVIEGVHPQRRLT